MKAAVERRRCHRRWSFRRQNLPLLLQNRRLCFRSCPSPWRTSRAFCLARTRRFSVFFRGGGWCVLFLPLFLPSRAREKKNRLLLFLDLLFDRFLSLSLILSLPLLFFPKLATGARHSDNARRIPLSGSAHRWEVRRERAGPHRRHGLLQAQDAGKTAPDAFHRYRRPLQARAHAVGRLPRAPPRPPRALLPRGARSASAPRPLPPPERRPPPLPAGPARQDRHRRAAIFVDGRAGQLRGRGRVLGRPLWRRARRQL